MITKKLAKNHHEKKIRLMFWNCSAKAQVPGQMTYYVQETYGSQMLKMEANSNIELA